MPATNPGPATHLTTFDFYIKSLADLNQAIIDEVGYEITPANFWTINITDHELRQFHITLTVCYWKDPNKKTKDIWE